MKRLLLWAVLVTFSLTTAWAQFSGSGSGTESDPYKIYNADQLHQVRNYLGQSGVVFKLMNDINMADYIDGNFGSQGWEPIGVESQAFKGVFYGNGKKLTGFSISRGTTNYVGLFGYIDGATINNLTIEGPVTGKNYVGAFVGCATGNCTLSSLTHNGTITANSYAGHIAGQYSGSISTATVTGNVTTTSGYVGGIVGYQDTSGKTISNVNMTGNVTVSSSYSTYVGGIAGFSNATISNAICSGNVTASNSTSSYIGGIAGKSTAAINNASYSGDVRGGYYVGGITGHTSGAVNTATVNGAVKGTNSTGYTGGVVGFADNGATITNARITGNVTGTKLVGGICGKSIGGTITNSYSYGNVTGTGKYVGGVLGEGVTEISKCASFGDISGTSYVGGVIGVFGEVDLEVLVFNSYTYSSTIYDRWSSKTETLGITNCYAIGNVTGTSDYVGGVCGYANGCSWEKEQDETITLYYGGYKMTKGVKTNVTETEKCATYHYYAVITKLNLSDSYFSGNLKGGNYVGGIVGMGNNVSVYNNYSYANISGSSNIGGVIGSVQRNSVTFSIYPYNSSSLFSQAISLPSDYTLELKSNMAINSSVIATSNAGRIYGSKGESGITVAAPGTTSDNRALESGRLVISGVTQELENSEQNGQNNAIRYFKLRANYVSHGWDLNNDWKISDSETETFPYKPWQAAPPTITSNLVSGSTSISGQSIDGGTVYVTAGKNAERSATCTDYSWTVTGLSTLHSGENVSLYAKVSGKENSYRTLATVESSGSGTQNDPWLIYDAYDLQGVYKDGYYKQMNDIDLTSWISANSSTAGWVPVGYNGTGSINYDGNNHKVTGLWVNSTEDYAGLFSSFTKGTIRNLTVEATSKQVKGSNYVGIVIGKIGEGTLENVTANGNVSAKNYVGGIAGYTSSTTLKQLSYTGQLTATGYVGGITSYATSGSFTECEAEDVVIKASASQYVGGLVAYPVVAISKCKASGSITLSGTHEGAYVGGLAGRSSNTISDCSTNVTISSASMNGMAAGLVAYSSSTVKLCTATGSVTSTGTGAYTGGLVAKTGTSTLVENCYSTANVTGTKWTAGLVAYNYGKVNRCYAAGNVESTYYGAGVVGENYGSSATITNCVALNTMINVSDQTGWSVRVVGNFSNGATEPNQANLLAWKDMQVSVNNVPKTVYDDNLEGTAITTAATKSSVTYQNLGWDFTNVWTMPSNGFPELKWLAAAAEPDVKLGDLDGNGTVSITDVVLIIDVIAGTITDANKKAAADVNGDGNVSITDCVAAIDLIAAQQTSNARMASNGQWSTVNGQYTSTDFISAALQDNMLNVSLDNERSYTAFQMVVAMPEGMTIGKAAMDRMRGEDHTVTVRDMGNGQYLVAGFSADNDVLMGNSGRLLSIVTNGQSTGDIVIGNVEFATNEAEGYRLAGAVVSSTTTGVTEIVNSKSSNSKCYDLQGRRVDSSIFNVQSSMSKKGLYIINGKKVNIK